MNYLVRKGIVKSRLTAKGFGESMLVNECVNDAPCSEEAHQLNRRTEFQVIQGAENIRIQGSVNP
jgi:outer membrane protein OmpA-like peptidoglycan-associated protein